MQHMVILLWVTRFRQAVVVIPRHANHNKYVLNLNRINCKDRGENSVTF